MPQKFFDENRPVSAGHRITEAEMIEAGELLLARGLVQGQVSSGGRIPARIRLTDDGRGCVAQHDADLDRVGPLRIYDEQAAVVLHTRPRTWPAPMYIDVIATCVEPRPSRPSMGAAARPQDPATGQGSLVLLGAASRDPPKPDGIPLSTPRVGPTPPHRSHFRHYERCRSVLPARHHQALPEQRVGPIAVIGMVGRRQPRRRATLLTSFAEGWTSGWRATVRGAAGVALYGAALVIGLISFTR